VRKVHRGVTVLPFIIEFLSNRSLPSNPSRFSRTRPHIIIQHNIVWSQTFIRHCAILSKCTSIDLVIALSSLSLRLISAGMGKRVIKKLRCGLTSLRGKLTDGRISSRRHEEKPEMWQKIEPPQTRTIATLLIGQGGTGKRGMGGEHRPGKARHVARFVIPTGDNSREVSPPPTVTVKK